MAEKPTGHLNRKSIRLQGFDYSAEGYYYLTLCTYKRQLIFGKIENGSMILNESGKIVCDEWVRSTEIRNEISLGEFVVMPNHIHGIVIINGHPRRGDRPVAPTGMSVAPTGMPVAPTGMVTMGDGKPNGPKSGSIGAMIAGYKSAVTTKINRTPIQLSSAPLGL